MNKSLILLLAITFFSFHITFAQASEKTKNLSAFQNLKKVERLNLKVPTVVEVSFENEIIKNNNFAVLELGTGEFQPYYFDKERNLIGHSVMINNGVGREKNLIDNDYKTFVDFNLPEAEQGVAEFQYRGEKEITSNSLIINLGRYVALPTYVEIRADNKIVFAKSEIESTVINFPRNMASLWQIKFWYSQPLRITELDLKQTNLRNNFTQGLRFLARPGMEYEIYFNPDRETDISLGEAGNLRDDKEVKKIQNYLTLVNPIYKEADIDRDSIPDRLDNCVKVANADQEDIDGNGRGDVCDDFDRDGVINSEDNCPDKPNKRQKDTDNDGIGDECDSEESRITEKYSWLPWTGMGLVMLVIGSLFIKTLREKN